MKTKSIGTPNLLKYLYMNIDKIITTELKNKILFKQLYPLDNNVSIGCIINGVDRRNFYQCHFLIKKS